jgi:hypothetical protein
MSYWKPATRRVQAKSRRSTSMVQKGLALPIGPVARRCRPENDAGPIDVARVGHGADLQAAVAAARPCGAS